MDAKSVARFWAKVDRSAGPDGCWLWTASKRPTGYGQFNAGAPALAHRVAWELTNGPVPSGKHAGTTCVCHRCDVPACVNPAHLFLGSQAENLRDMAAKGRHARGETNGAAKLSAAQVAGMRADRAAGMPQAELAAKYGVSQPAVSRIVTGKTWAHYASPIG